VRPLGIGKGSLTCGSGECFLRVRFKCLVFKGLFWWAALVVSMYLGAPYALFFFIFLKKKPLTDQKKKIYIYS
jgi:hypothetical protein